jgi:hypothetical protein
LAWALREAASESTAQARAGVDSFRRQQRQQPPNTMETLQVLSHLGALPFESRWMAGRAGAYSKTVSKQVKHKGTPTKLHISTSVCTQDHACHKPAETLFFRNAMDNVIELQIAVA